MAVVAAFQFLIGTLKTKTDKDRSYRKTLISIPYRHSKNEIAIEEFLEKEEENFNSL